MPIDFYYLPGSAPCRAVLLTAKAVNVDLNLKMTQLMQGEHLTPEFIKINPQHTIPTIVDDGYSLWDSHAICAYLANQYSKDDSLYPKDPKSRGIVDQRLYFNIGTLYLRYSEAYYPFMFADAKTVEEAKLEKLDEAFNFLNTFIGNNQYAAGEKLTIADLALVASVSTADVCGYDVRKYPNVAKWYDNCKKTIVGYDELNQSGVDMFGGLYKDAVKRKSA